MQHITYTIRYKQPAKRVDTGIPDSLYLSDRELLKALQQAISMTEIQQLYNENKKRIDTNPELKACCAVLWKG
jgi:hypothetical protein